MPPSVNVWDGRNAECIRRLLPDTETILTIAWSHDSTWLAAGSAGGRIDVWSTREWHPITVLKRQTDQSPLSTSRMTIASLRQSLLTAPLFYGHQVVERGRKAARPRYRARTVRAARVPLKPDDACYARQERQHFSHLGDQRDVDAPEARHNMSMSCRRRSAPIPPYLVNAVKEQRVVLFAGAAEYLL